MKGTMLVMALLVLCAGCGTRDEEVIRLLVSAEVAELQAIEPRQVTVTSVAIDAGGIASARAEYGPLGSRGGEVVTVDCLLTRKEHRWHVDRCRVKEE